MKYMLVHIALYVYFLTNEQVDYCMWTTETFVSCSSVCLPYSITIRLGYIMNVVNSARSVMYDSG